MADVSFCLHAFVDWTRSSYQYGSRCPAADVLFELLHRQNCTNYRCMCQQSRDM